MEIAASICPRSRSARNSATPAAAPTAPPASNTPPMRKSTLPRRAWASIPDTDAAAIWFASLPTAMAGGTPAKINSGVIRNPPPTPNMPDRKPTPAPMPSRSSTLTDISAMGR